MSSEILVTNPSKPSTSDPFVVVSLDPQSTDRDFAEYLRRGIKNFLIAPDGDLLTTQHSRVSAARAAAVELQTSVSLIFELLVQRLPEPHALESIFNCLHPSSSKQFHLSLLLDAEFVCLRGVWDMDSVRQFKRLFQLLARPTRTLVRFDSKSNLHDALSIIEAADGILIASTDIDSGVAPGESDYQRIVFCLSQKATAGLYTVE